MAFGPLATSLFCLACRRERTGSVLSYSLSCPRLPRPHRDDLLIKPAESQGRSPVPTPTTTIEIAAWNYVMCIMALCASAPNYEVVQGKCGCVRHGAHVQRVF